MDLWHSLQHSGVGWFNDIFSVVIYFDADLEERGGVPHVQRFTNAAGEEDTMIEYSRALFASGAQVSGFVRITSPPGRTISHNGVRMRLESGLAAADDIITRDLYEEETEIVPAGTVTGTVDYPFLFNGTGRTPLCDSFEGDLFSVRHSVIATVHRPWYTFEVTQSKPFAVQRINVIHPRSLVNALGFVTIEPAAVPAAAPPTSAAATAAAAPAASPTASPELAAQLALYTEQRMTIPDGCGCGGTIAVRYNKGCYEMGETLDGAVDFKGVTKPVVLVRLAVVRVETAAAELSDTVIFDETVLDARRWRQRKTEAAWEAAQEKAARAAEAAGEAADEEVSSASPARRKVSSSIARSTSDGSTAGFRPAGAADELDAGAHAAEVAAAKAGSSKAAITPIAVDDGSAATVAVAAAGAGSSAPASAAAAPASAAAAAEEEDEDAQWMPDNDDFAAEEIDQDLPILGDVSLSLALDFGLIEKLTPTMVVPLVDEVEVAAAAKRKVSAASTASAASSTTAGSATSAVAAAAKGAEEAGKAASVRYYLRITVYTRFDAESRSWNAQEIVLYREALHGDRIPPERRPMADFLTIGQARKKPSAAGAGGATAPTPTATAAGGAGKVPVPLDAAAAHAGATSPKLTPSSATAGGGSGGGAVPPPLSSPLAGPVPTTVVPRPMSGSFSSGGAPGSSPLVTGGSGGGVPPLVRSSSGRGTAGWPTATTQPSPGGGLAGLAGPSPRMSPQHHPLTPHLSPHVGPVAGVAGGGGGDDDIEDAESGMAGPAALAARKGSSSSTMSGGVARGPLAQGSPHGETRAGMARGASFSSVGSGGGVGATGSTPARV